MRLTEAVDTAKTRGNKATHKQLSAELQSEKLRATLKLAGVVNPRLLSTMVDSALRCPLPLCFLAPSIPHSLAPSFPRSLHPSLPRSLHPSLPRSRPPVLPSSPPSSRPPSLPSTMVESTLRSSAFGSLLRAEVDGMSQFWRVSQANLDF